MPNLKNEPAVIAADLFVRTRGLEGLGLGHLDQYFGPWAILEEPFRTAVERINGMDMAAHVRATQAATAEPKASSRESDYPLTSDGVALIAIQGEMMKFASSLSAATSTVWVRRQLRAATADERVKAILLTIDSPGGTVAGTRDLADDVVAAGQRKPLWAFIEDMGASAAYWVASQAERVYTNATAMVGSIGTFAVLEDYSGAAAAKGIKVHVLRAGAHKGTGVPGTEVTAEQLAEWQRKVDELNEFFLAGVSAGRKLPLEKVRQLADGRVHVGAAAQGLGLTDGVRSIDQVLGELSTKVSTRRTRAMSEPTNAPAAGNGPRAATIQELKAACPGASADWLMGQLEASATVEQASKAHLAEMAKQLAAAQAELNDLKTKGTSGKAAFQPLETRSGTPEQDESSGEPVEAFDAAVREVMKSGATRQSAVARVAARNPKLHQAYLLATNPGLRAQRLIQEKYS
jgi:signal peptide peptidase SppA